jgi:hypothetical protein
MPAFLGAVPTLALLRRSGTSLTVFTMPGSGPARKRGFQVIDGLRSLDLRLDVIVVSFLTC